MFKLKFMTQSHRQRLTFSYGSPHLCPENIFYERIQKYLYMNIMIVHHHEVDSTAGLKHNKLRTK
jgi:hypothetical protein